MDNYNLQTEAERLKDYINTYIQERFKVDHLNDQRATLKIKLNEETYTKNYTEVDLIV